MKIILAFLTIALFSFGANATLTKNKCERIKVMVDRSLDVSLDGNTEELQKFMPSVNPKDASVELMRLSSNLAMIYNAFCKD